jgi:hypothetical protein
MQSTDFILMIYYTISQAWFESLLITPTIILVTPACPSKELDLVTPATSSPR